MAKHALPAIFVLLWSSGFVACKAGLYYAEPFTFLLLRFGFAAAILATIALAMRAPWPRDRILTRHLAVSGLLIHGSYLGPNFWAASRGFPVGLTALIGALQPLLTAVLAWRFMAERITPPHWLGLALGFIGIVMVLSDKLAFDWSHPLELALVGIALVSLTLGTLYQKRYCAQMDLRTGSVVQLGSAAVLMLAGGLVFESFHVDWHPVFILALGHLVLLSAVMYAIMHVLFQRGAASRVASLFYLVPPLTSFAMFALFDEKLGPLALIGMAVTVFGVALAARR